MSKFAYCLFDLDGTLTLSGPGITRCAQVALRHFGIDEPDLRKLEVFVGPPLNETFREVYHLNDDQIQEGVRIFRERYEKTGIFENDLIPGTPEMLKKVKDHGIRTAIASSKPQNMVYRVLDHFGIRQYFEVIVGGDPAHELQRGAVKSDKELVMQRALEAFSATDPNYREKTAMVGDTHFDMEGAAAHGVYPVGVSFGYGTRAELEASGARFIADSMEALGDFLIS